MYATRLLNDLYLMVKHHENTLKGFRVMGRKRFKKLWEVTPKRSKLELSFLYATRLLNVLYILLKYHENILKGFKVMVRTKFYNFRRLWEITPEPSRLKLSFLHATLLPNILYNLTKFYENSSKGIGVMCRTSFRLQTDAQTDSPILVQNQWPKTCPFINN